MIQEAPGGSRRPQEAPGGSRMFPGGSRRPQEAPGGSRGLPGSSRRLQEVPGGSQSLQEAPGGSQEGKSRGASWFGYPQSTSGSTRISAGRGLGYPQKSEPMRNCQKVGDRATPEGWSEPDNMMCSYNLACFTVRDLKLTSDA